MLKVGITGGIGSGKSTVAAILRSYSFVALDADQIAHQAYSPGTAGYEALLEEFGRGIVAKSGEIDRAKLGAIVFRETPLLRKLERIVWPLTRERISLRIRELELQNAPAVALEASQLLEAGWDALVDKIWLVEAAKEAVLARLVSKHKKVESAKRIMEVQSSKQERFELAQITGKAVAVIRNDGSKDALRDQVAAVLEGRS